MSIADEMRNISKQNGTDYLQDAYEYSLKWIKHYASEGRRESVFSPYSPKKDADTGYGYLSARDKELLRDRLRADGFTVCVPHRYSSGVLQITEYIQW